MSTRKTSLTDKQTKNGTSKYVLERCASINEYYDIAFKVCIPVLSCVLFVVFSPPLCGGTGVRIHCGFGTTCSSDANTDIWRRSANH